MFRVGDQIGEFKILDILGEGAEGRVFKVRWQTRRGERIGALKVMKTHDFQGVLKEVSNWASASQHKNILKFHTAGHENGVFYTVSELAAGGDLEEWIIYNGGKPECYAEAVDIMLGALEGLHHLHQHDIIHRDIKPSNIFLRDGVPVLADFGLARGLNFSQSTVAAGTRPFMSPELAKKYMAIDNGTHQSYERTEADDLWAMGATFQRLLTADWTFDGLQQIVDCQPKPLPGDMPPVIRKFLQKTFRPHIGERFQTALEMGIALNQIKIELLTSRAHDREKELELKLEQQRQEFQVREAELVARLRAAGIDPDVSDEILNSQILDDSLSDIRKLAAAPTDKLDDDKILNIDGNQLVADLPPVGSDEAPIIPVKIPKADQAKKNTAAVQQPPAVAETPQKANSPAVKIILAVIGLILIFWFFSRDSSESTVATASPKSSPDAVNINSSANDAVNYNASIHDNRSTMSNAALAMSNAVVSLNANSMNTNSAGNSSASTTNSSTATTIRTGSYYEDLGDKCKFLDYECEITNYKNAVNASFLPSKTAYSKLGFAYRSRASNKTYIIAATARMYQNIDYNSATEAFTEHIELNPEGYNGYYGLGLVQHEQKKYDEAVKSFSTAINKNRLKANVFLARAETYGSLGKKSRVKADCLEYRSLTEFSFNGEKYIFHGICGQYMPARPLPKFDPDTLKYINPKLTLPKSKLSIP